MGVERVFDEDEYDQLMTEYYVQQVSGMTASEASSRISTNGLTNLRNA